MTLSSQKNEILLESREPQNVARSTDAHHDAMWVTAVGGRTEDGDTLPPQLVEIAPLHALVTTRQQPQVVPGEEFVQRDATVQIPSPTMARIRVRVRLTFPRRNVVSGVWVPRKLNFYVGLNDSW